jgi:hypothetical protein
MLIPKDVYLLGRENVRGNFIITIVFVEILLCCNFIWDLGFWISNSIVVNVEDFLDHGLSQDIGDAELDVANRATGLRGCCLSFVQTLKEIRETIVWANIRLL